MRQFNNWLAGNVPVWIFPAMLPFYLIPAIVFDMTDGHPFGAVMCSLGLYQCIIVSRRLYVAGFRVPE